CLELSEVAQVINEAELDDDEAEGLYEEIQQREIDLTDDFGRQQPDSTYVNGDLAEATTDALQLFLNEMGKYRLLTAEEEVELAKRIGRGDKEAGGRVWSCQRASGAEKGGGGFDGQTEPSPWCVRWRGVPGPRAHAAGPDPG